MSFISGYLLRTAPARPPARTPGKKTAAARPYTLCFHAAQYNPPVPPVCFIYDRPSKFKKQETIIPYFYVITQLLSMLLKRAILSQGSIL